MLRIPGTLNHKYKSEPRVKVVLDKLGDLSSFPLHTLLGGHHTPENGSPTPQTIDLPDERPLRDKLRRKHRKLFQQLTRDYDKGKRSEILWALTRDLVDLGWTDEQIVAVVINTELNKFKGRHDEVYRLLTGVQKARKAPAKEERRRSSGSPSKPLTREPVDAPDDPDDRTLEIVSYNQLMSSNGTHPGWLIRGVWSRNSWGIVAGSPKSFKSTLVLEMAVSVASGHPFLNRFEVCQEGPVLIIQNENSDWIMKERLQNIIATRGLGGKIRHRGGQDEVVRWPRDLPIEFINQQGVVLDSELDQELILKAALEIKPVLIVFDPLYLMVSGDLNSAKELQPALNWLLYLQKQTGSAIVVIHHKRKNNKTGRGGENMLGSTILHGWTESSWFCDSTTDENGQAHTVKVTKEFRGAPSGAPLNIKITNTGEYEAVIDDDGDDLDIVSKRVNYIIAAIRKKAGYVTFQGLLSELGCRPSYLKKALKVLEREAILTRSKKDGVRVWVKVDG